MEIRMNWEQLLSTETQVKREVEPEDFAKYPMDYGELTAKCKERYSNFILNGDYHANRRLYESDDKCAYIRYLDPDKKKSGKKVFYSEAMLSKLDNHYTRK